MQLEVGKAKTIMENNLKMVLRSKRCNQSVAIQFGHVFQIVPNLPKLSKIFPNLSTLSKPWKMFQNLKPSKKTKQNLCVLSVGDAHLRQLVPDTKAAPIPAIPAIPPSDFFPNVLVVGAPIHHLFLTKCSMPNNM